MTVMISTRGFIGAAIVGMMVVASGAAQAQSVQRSTAQPLGAAGVPPQPSSPASPLTTASGGAMAAKPGASNPSPQRFTSEADARTACGSQPVVWVNTRSKKFFASGAKLYGKTRSGTFMCRDTATAGGFSAAKS